MRPLQAPSETRRLSKVGLRTRNLERRFIDFAFAVGQRKSFTAAANAITNLYPFDDFDTTSNDVFEQDGGTGALRAKIRGLYKLEAWTVLLAPDANIPAATHPSLVNNTGGISPPNSVIGWDKGMFSNVTGRIVGTGPTIDQWDLHFTSYFNIGDAPYLFSTSLIGNGATANTWQIDWAILVARRIGAYSSELDLQPFGT